MSILVVLIIALIVTAKLAEDKITDLALKRVSESIEAPVLIDEVSFNLLRKFPFATIELYNVTLGAPQKNQPTDSTFAQSDTIFYFKEIFVSVKSKPLLKGNFEIVKVNIDEAEIHYRIDTSGVSNIDFLLVESDTTQVDTIQSDPLSFILDDFAAWNITCYYKDDLLKTQAKVVIPELKVNAEMNKSRTFASIIGRLQLTQIKYDETNLYLMNNMDIRYDLIYNNDSVNIKTLKIDTDGAKLSLFGNIILGDEIKTDVKIGGTDLILDELVKYAPQSILNEYGLRNVSGNMTLDASAKGVYTDSELPQIDLSIGLKGGNLKAEDYPELKNISFTGRATNGILRNNQSTQAEFSSLHFETEKSKFDISFSILDVDNLKYTINTDMDININEFQSFIPDSIIENIDGNVKLKLATRGEFPDSVGDDFVDYLMANTRGNAEFIDLNVDVDSSLSIKNFSAQIGYKPNGLKINNLNFSIPSYQLELKNTSFNAGFTGSIDKPATMKIDLKSYHLETKGSVITGKVKVENLDNPAYELESRIRTNLEEAKVMLPDSLVKSLSGSVVLDVMSKARLNLDSLSTQYMDIVFKNSEFHMQLDNINAELYEDSLYKIEKFSGVINMTPDVISINKMNGIAGGIEFGVDSTDIKNIYNTVIRNRPEKLLVNTRINMGDLSYTMFAPFMESDSTVKESKADSSQATEEESTNYTILVKGVAKVNSFVYDDILIEDISTLFNATDSVYTLDKLKFKAFNGKMKTSLRYSIKANNESVIQMNNRIVRMDVKKLLTDFDNFAAYYEPSITAENISGLFSTDLYSQVEFIGDSIVYNKIRVRGDIRLEDGGVYDFEPATELSKFTGIKELDNIQFKTLNSKIFIFKNAIFVPETFIASNALNITAYGKQSFGEDYEYHLEIKLSDVLFGKSKKQRRKEKKSGDRADGDDRNMRELVYYKLDGKTKYGFDSKEMQRKMKTTLKLNENLLNLRFHPEMFTFETGVYKSK